MGERPEMTYRFEQHGRAEVTIFRIAQRLLAVHFVVDALVPHERLVFQLVRIERALL